MPTGGSPFVFLNDLRPDRPLSENALSHMLRRVGIPAVPHGFRSSFRVWAEEDTDASYAAMELSIAHKVGSKRVCGRCRYATTGIGPIRFLEYKNVEDCLLNVSGRHGVVL